MGIGILLAASIVTGAACTGERPEVKPPSPTPAASVAPTVSPTGSPSVTPATAGPSKPDSLVGRWTGPEATYLNVSKKGDKYSIEIANLDGPKSYEGTAKGGVIEFSRNGKTETIKTATGAETGMKGFEKETNCVVVTKGSEGFCKK